VLVVVRRKAVEGIGAGGTAVRKLIRAALLLGGAAAFCIALSAAASADMVEPNSAYQPASVALLNEEAAKDAALPTEEAAAKQQAEAKKAEAKKAEEAEKAANPQEAVPATPAPEQVVRQVPAHLTRPINERSEQPSVAEKIVHPFRAGLQQIGASLGRVVSACDVLPGTGAGGPVFVLAVLSLVAPFIRRRVVDTRWAADEDVPEFLYAQELTPPG
jgi:hypothetical protein